jgi:hypothetical protein
VQPYPSEAKEPRRQAPSVPAPVRNAVKVMYLGAVAQVAYAVVFIATASATKEAIRVKHPHYTAHQLAQTQRGAVIVGVVVGMIGVALFIWIAQQCQRGKSWARIVAAVLLVLAVIGAASGRTPEASADRVVAVVIVVIGLVALVLLWLPQSSAYFEGSKKAPA